MNDHLTGLAEPIAEHARILCRVGELDARLPASGLHQDVLRARQGVMPRRVEAALGIVVRAHGNARPP